MGCRQTVEWMFVAWLSRVMSNRVVRLKPAVLELEYSRVPVDGYILYAEPCERCTEAEGGWMRREGCGGVCVRDRVIPVRICLCG